MLFSARHQIKKNITGTLRIQFDEDKEDGDDELTVEDEDELEVEDEEDEEDEASEGFGHELEVEKEEEEDEVLISHLSIAKSQIRPKLSIRLPKQVNFNTNDPETSKFWQGV